MRKFVYTIQEPISIDRLVEICVAMKDMDRVKALEYGKECGLTKHNVDSIRQMLGYSNPEAFKHKTNEEREAIVDEYREGGVSMCELARKHGIGYNSVRCLIVNRDVTIYNPKKWERRQELFLKNEIKKGTPLKKVAEMLGKSLKCVQQKAKRMERDDLLVKEYTAGSTFEEIAKKMGIDEKCVAELIRRLKRDGKIKEED